MNDMWQYKPSVPEERPLVEHIDALWRDIAPSKAYLMSLKEHATVDIFLGYRSNWMDGGVHVPAPSLDMFIELEIPFSLSIIRI